MIRIKRAPLPEHIEGRMRRLTDQIIGNPEEQRADHARKLWKHSTVRRQVRAPLADVLRDMAPGREHCMYCGDNQGTDIDHHEPLAHNPLRTFDWLNHLLSCAMCNSHQKRDRFPVDDAGRCLLIDPTEEDPFEHLLLTLSLGVYHPLTDKGKATMEVCGLNRPLLVRGRLQARRVVELSLERWSAAHLRYDEPAKNEAVLTVMEQPFADVCQSMLRQAAGVGAGAVFAGQHRMLEILCLPELRAALVGIE